MKFKTFILILLIASASYVSTPKQASAQIPFGGPILATYECGCSGGWFILVLDLKTKLPVPMTFQFGFSMPRANYNFFTPTVQTVGSIIPGGVCVLASTSCGGGFPTAGTVTPIGFPGIGTGAI